MRILGYCAAAYLALCAFPDVAQADPIDTSCRLSEIIGQNQATEVHDAMEIFARNWVAPSRVAVISRLEGLLKKPVFAGGSVYRVAKLGEDFEEHLLVLRLRKGEVSGARLLYEWTPDGLALTNLEIKGNLYEITRSGFMQSPEIIECP